MVDKWLHKRFGIFYLFISCVERLNLFLVFKGLLLPGIDIKQCLP